MTDWIYINSISNSLLNVIFTDFKIISLIPNFKWNLVSIIDKSRRWVRRFSWKRKYCPIENLVYQCFESFLNLANLLPDQETLKIFFGCQKGLYKEGKLKGHIYFLWLLLAEAICHCRPKPLLRACVLSYLFLWTGYLGVSLSHHIVPMCLSIMWRSFGSAVLWMYSTLLLQLRVPDHLLGRMLALEMAFFTVSPFWIDSTCTDPALDCAIVLQSLSYLLAYWKSGKNYHMQWE